MAMRIGGLMSGMDTESIIQELVAAKRVKVDDAKKAQTKLEWKQDKWKELNSKLMNLYQKTLNNMRFATDFSKKVTTASNNAVSIITGDNAIEGEQNMQVVHTAKRGYLTGEKISASDASMKLSELDPTNFGNGESGSFDITFGNGDVKSITVDGDSTISDVLTQLQGAGLNASFDTKNNRIFISSKESGASNDFNISAASGSAGEKAMKALGIGSGAKKNNGQDAEILLNGASFTSNDNTFEINGLTITCLEETAGEFSVTTKEDTSGMYDNIKNFITEYNSIINEMDKLYNADSAKGYEPLTSEEKASMSESDIEAWEKKVKDSILRRDSSVSTVSSALKEVMASGVEVNGKKMFLSDFGIETLSYFNSSDYEKNAYHIAGDEDDANTASQTNTLAAMIASDSDTVTAFFTGLSQNLYEKMGELSKSVEGYSSFNSFYEDKKMKEDYNNYTTKISDLESKLKDYEDKWYAKFAAMETAMAKMQQNASAVTSLLGGS